MSRSNVLRIEYFALFLLVTFSIFVRVFSPTFITIVCILTFISIISFDFYKYIINVMREEARKKNILEYSWGVVSDNSRSVNLDELSSFLISRDLNFLWKYIFMNAKYIIFGIFIFGDLLIAFKNLDLNTAGVYITMSLFTKFVFIAVYYLEKIYEKKVITDDNKEEVILKTFNIHTGSFLSTYAVLFIIFFILSEYIVEIFFGYSFFQYHSSLPFILLGNISLAIMFLVYITSVKIDEKVTTKLLKVYGLLFCLLFVFVDNSYIDTVTYFVVGMSTLYSIILYNLVIKKPEYIRNTYNHLF